MVSFAFVATPVLAVACLALVLFLREERSDTVYWRKQAEYYQSEYWGARCQRDEYEMALNAIRAQLDKSKAGREKDVAGARALD